MPVDDFGFVIVYKLKYIMRYRQYLDILYKKYKIKLKVDDYIKKWLQEKRNLQ